MNKTGEIRKIGLEGESEERLNFAEYIRIKILVAFTIMKACLEPEKEQEAMEYEQLFDKIFEVDTAIQPRVIVHNRIAPHSSRSYKNRDVHASHLKLIPCSSPQY